jgi:hypothetical protein
MDLQRRAADHLRTTLAARTVQRIFRIAKAAMNLAWQNRKLDRQVPFISIPGGRGREWVLDIPN